MKLFLRLCRVDGTRKLAEEGTDIYRRGRAMSETDKISPSGDFLPTLRHSFSPNSSSSSSTFFYSGYRVHVHMYILIPWFPVRR